MLPDIAYQILLDKYILYLTLCIVDYELLRKNLDIKRN